jgi:hypothetical protein
MASEQEWDQLRIDQNAHSFLFGPRISRRGKKIYAIRLRALRRDTCHEEECRRVWTKNVWHGHGFSARAFGGGLDLKVTKHVSIRTFPIDYFRPNFFGESHNRGGLAFGVVLNFGSRD